ncbi:MAG: hypothetical protein JRI68_03245 [Deltaproteobacteria bacterium]|nr:hypothetical protein [Deltaproteobacteria bacterium]
MNSGIGRAGKWAATLLGLLAVTSVAAGCAIHTQGPIKEVAYDFSDRDFYDRSYSPSPNYQPVHLGHGAPLQAPAEQVTASMFQGIPALPPASVETSVVIDSGTEPVVRAAPSMALRPITAD